MILNLRPFLQLEIHDIQRTYQKFMRSHFLKMMYICILMEVFVGSHKMTST